MSNGISKKKKREREGKQDKIASETQGESDFLLGGKLNINLLATK